MLRPKRTSLPLSFLPNTEACLLKCKENNWMNILSECAALITRNVKDFKAINKLKLFNPYEI